MDRCRDALKASTADAQELTCSLALVFSAQQLLQDLRHKPWGLEPT